MSAIIENNQVVFNAKDIGYMRYLEIMDHIKSSYMPGRTRKR
jgi:hypothetical protein